MRFDTEEYQQEMEELMLKRLKPLYRHCRGCGKWLLPANKNTKYCYQCNDKETDTASQREKSDTKEHAREARYLRKADKSLT